MYTVVVTISAKMLVAMAGLYTTFYGDLYRAMSLANAPVAPKSDISALTKEYRFPRTVQEVKDLCRYIVDYAEGDASPEKWAISLDTETNTLFPHRDGLKLLCISVAWGNGKAAAIPLWHKDTPYNPVDVIPAVRELLVSTKPKIMHNAKYDSKVFRKMTLEVFNLTWDTMLAEHALEEDKRGQYGLKPLTRVFFPEFTEYADRLHELLAKEEGDSQLDNIRKKQKTDGEAQAAALSSITPALTKKIAARKKKGQEGGFENLPLDELLLYAAIDTDMTRRLAGLQVRRIAAEERTYREKRVMVNRDRTRQYPVPFLCQDPEPIRNLVKQTAVPLSEVLGRMEFRGIKVDRAYMDDLDEKLSKVVEDTERELYELADKNDLKLNSAAAIANILFSEGFIHPVTKERTFYPVVTLTKRNQAQTTEKVLKFLVAKYACPFSSKKLIYSKAYKAKNTFIANVRDLSEIDGFLHTNYNIHGTGTGRLSSSDENMQNIPKKLAGYSIKKIFIPDDPSMAFVNCDAKGAEVRIFSAYSQDQELIKSLNDGMDTHCFFADAIVSAVRAEIGADEVLESMGLDNKYPLTYDDFNAREKIRQTNPSYGEMLDKFRTAIKRVVFGILYGAGSKKIAETIGINLSQAQAIIEMLFQLYPSIPAYIDRTKWELNTFGLVETYFGRRRRFAVKGATGFLRSRAERQAVNFKIQSTSSDIVLACLNEIEKPLERDLGGRLLLTVHDSIGFQLPKKYVSQLPDFVDRYLNIKPGTKYLWLPVEFKWDYELGPSYGELKPFETYVAGLTPEEIRNDAKEAYTEEEVKIELASTDDA
jgi:DNA polymerase I-like protein with 3'-5' exonuclease and polymerase domains